MKKIIQIADVRWCPEAMPDTDASYPSCWIIRATSGAYAEYWFFVDLEDYVLTEGQLLEVTGDSSGWASWELARIL